MEGYLILDTMDQEDTNTLLYKENVNAKEEKKLTMIKQKHEDIIKFIPP